IIVHRRAFHQHVIEAISENRNKVGEIPSRQNLRRRLGTTSRISYYVDVLVFRRVDKVIGVFVLILSLRLFVCLLRADQELVFLRIKYFQITLTAPEDL